MLLKKTNQKIRDNINESFDNYKDFMSDFFQIFKLIKPNFNLSNNNNVDGKKLILVLLGSNNDFKVYDYIVSKYKFKKDNLDMYCLGKNGFEKFLGSGFNMLGYSNITNDVEESDLEDVWMYISAIKSGKYENISICYLDKNDELVEFDLFPICLLDIEYFSNRFGINVGLENDDIEELCVRPGKDEVEIEVLMQYIQHIIYGIILEYKINNYQYLNLISLNIFNKIATN